MRKCKKCGENRQLKMFSLSKSCNGMYYRIHTCNKCRALKNKKYNSYHKEYSKKYREKNKEKIKETIKNYRKNLYGKYGFGISTIRRLGLELAIEVYNKAGNKCELCGNKNDLTVHHLDGNGRHNEEKNLLVNNDIDNLQILCRGCHGRIHGKQNKGRR